MEIIRTKEEIDKKIKELSNESMNFSDISYHEEGADIFYCQFETENTLKDFLKWLTKNE
jgi:hypothetical protein